MSKESKSPVTWIDSFVWPAIVFIITGTVFFRTFLLSRFDVVLGEHGDARLDIFIREHILQFLRGKAPFTSPPMFFPIKDTLGYSDSYLLDQLIYAPSRLLGADWFLSFQFVGMGLSLIGFVFFNIMLVRFARVLQPLAAIASAAFTFSNALFISVGHPQLLEVNFCPVVMVLVLEAIRSSAAHHLRAVVTAFFGGLILALLFSTGYYVAWFFTFVGLITLVFVAILQNGRRITLYMSVMRKHFFLGTVFSSGFIIGLIPFLRIYAPVVAQFRGRSFSEYLHDAPLIRELVNVGKFNVVWGSALDLFNIVPKDHLDSGEFVLAVTPALLFTYLACVVAVLSGRALNEPEYRAVRNVFIGSFAAFAIVAITMIKTGTSSLFWLEWHLLPGARAIRSGGRAQIVLTGIAAGCAAIVLSRVLQVSDLRWLRIGLWGLAIFFLLEQVNTIDNNKLSRREEMARIAAPTPAPGCKAFFISPHTQDRGETIEQIDAMLIAQSVGIPTLNGYSGWSPPAWPLREINNPSYVSNVWRWATDQGITKGLCAYEFAERRWRQIGEKEIEKMLGRCRASRDLDERTPGQPSC